MIAFEVFQGLKEKSNQRTAKVFELIRFNKKKKRWSEERSKAKKKNNNETVPGRMRAVDLWDLSYHKDVIRATGVNQVVKDRKKMGRIRNRKRRQHKVDLEKEKKKQKRAVTNTKKELESDASSNFSKMSYHSDFEQKLEGFDIYSQEDVTSHKVLMTTSRDLKFSKMTDGGSLVMRNLSHEFNSDKLDYDNLNSLNLDDELRKYFLMNKMGMRKKRSKSNSRNIKRKKKKGKFCYLYVQENPKDEETEKNGKIKKFTRNKISRSNEIRSRNQIKRAKNYLSGYERKQLMNKKLESLLTKIDKTRKIYDKINEQVKVKGRYKFTNYKRRVKERRMKKLQNYFEEKNLKDLTI